MKLIGGSTWLDNCLSSNHKRAAEIIRLELNYLLSCVPLDRILIITVTFADPVPNRKIREARISRAIKFLFRRHFLFGVVIFDRSDTGRPHYHVIVVGPESANFRGNFDFAAWDRFSVNEQRWTDSGHADHVAEGLMRDATRRYLASARPELRAVWVLLRQEANRLNLGRVNALPLRNPIAYSKYFARCVTNVYRMGNPEDSGLRRYRFWGGFPRVVMGKFTRLTKGATAWRGKLAFCAHVLDFSDFEDFSKCFGPRWFIYLKGIVRTVPAEIGAASLRTRNLPLPLLNKYRSEVRKIQVELLDRLDRYGRVPADTHQL